MYGRQVTVKSDHKPLEVITKNPLHQAQKRLQHMLLRIQAYSINPWLYEGVHNVPAWCSEPGVSSLSRKSNNCFRSQEHQHDAGCVPKTIHSPGNQTAHSKGQLPSRANQGYQGRLAQDKGGTFSSRITILWNTWWTECWWHIVAKGERLVVPKLLCQELMQRHHYEHSSVVSSLSKAKECIYWPGMSGEIQQFIETWDICRTYNRKPIEVLISHEVPERPRAKVGIDQFGYRSRNYLICVDYYSLVWEIDLLDNT